MKKTPHPHSSKHSDTESKHPKEASQEASAEVNSPSESEPLCEVEQLKNEVKKYRDQALHAAADLENYRKRMMREKEETIRYANNSLLEKLLPIMDNFELGLDAARINPEAKAVDIVNGLSMVQRQLTDFLKEQGLQSIDAEGEVFDPKVHDALGHETHPELEEGKIIRQMRRGYSLAGRLLRPASVIVSKGLSENA